MGEGWVVVDRGGGTESRHRIHVVAWHAERGRVGAAGDPGFRTVVRSAIKMFQALPLIVDGLADRLRLTDEELALCTASHGGEPFHVAAARTILRKADVPESALACGAHFPLHAPSADAMRVRGESPGRIHNNCSGKHAGMLAVCAGHGWPLDTYHHLDHPLQHRVRGILGEWSGIDPQALAPSVDGCGLPTFAMPLDALARAAARYAAAAADGDPGPSRLTRAMTRHPEFVAGSDRLCTDLMRTAGGRLFAKVGAEGCYCAGVPDQRLGIAVKVEDGAWRAVEPALLATLRALDALTDADMHTLARYARPTVRNTRDEPVGTIRAAINLAG